jgi:hypothetical protein
MLIHYPGLRGFIVDEFHEDSDYDDFLKDELEEEEHDWR